MATDEARRIIHVDLDAFYCSVEELLDPSLRGRPIVVGADPAGRGVVAAASYAARKYGLHSGMPIGRAARRCPHAVFLRPRHQLYAEYSRKVMALLGEYTPLLEQISIDEAFLDVTGSGRLYGAAQDTGRAIQRRVLVELGLPCTVGIGTNKLMAKAASDSGKPHGFVVVPPGQEADFLAPLAVDRLWGVGPKTAQRLRAQGVRTIGELAALPLEKLRAQFGKVGEYLHQRANGLDHSPVEPSHQAKSISRAHTFDRDTASLTTVEGKLLELSEDVAQRLRGEGWRARTITLRLRYADFTTITRSQTLPSPTDLEEAIYGAGGSLLRREWAGSPPVRLVGIGASNLVGPAQVQASLFDKGEEKEKLAQAVDRLRARYGQQIVRRGKVGL